jgi:hypothetical protein
MWGAPSSAGLASLERFLSSSNVTWFNAIEMRTPREEWVQARYAAMGLSGALTGLSAHFTAGSSQLMHCRSVRPEMVTTGTIRFPHFGQRVV